MGKYVAVFALALLLGGCWNGNQDNIHLDSVSLGQQLIDLKVALEQDALSQEEYQQVKQWLLSTRIPRKADPTPPE